VAKNSIGRLLGRREQLPAEVADAIARLGRLAEATPALGQAAAIQGAILRAAYAQTARIGPLDIPPERAAEKRAAGVPLLHGEDVPIDMPAVEAALLRMCQAAGPHLERPGDASAIAGAIRRRQLPVADIVRQTLDGAAAELREQADEQGLNGQLFGTLLRFSLFPALTQLAAEQAPPHGAAAWDPGYCPTCGSWPLLAEHRGLEQLRHLRCGLCASEWPAERLRCPLCGSRDHADLGFLHVDGADHERAATCEHCRGYVKVVASLGALAPLDLVVQDLATLHLDMIALERGYVAPQ
jgi:FdhE protein